MDLDDLKIYKGITPYNIWYAIQHEGRWAYLCSWGFVDGKVYFTQTQCVPPDQLFETSWLDLMVVRGVSKDQVIQWIKENTHEL